MVRRFGSSKISLSIAESKLYDDTTAFNEQNVMEYLAEVEEYIKCLITVMANQFGVKCPILILLGLDELPKKIEPSVFPKDHILNNMDGEDEEVNEEMLNNMLNKTKFDSMMKDVLEKRREESKVPEEEIKATEVNNMNGNRRAIESKEEDLIKDMAGEHMVDEVENMVLEEENKEEEPEPEAQKETNNDEVKKED